MNKFIKKIRYRALDVVVGHLGKAVALDIYKRLSERLGVESVTVSGESGSISGSPAELVMGSYIYYHHYCPDMVDLVTKRLLKNGAGTFIDIGANIGLITVPVASGSQAIVHAFEPEPNNFNYLTRNVTANLTSDRVIMHNVALGSSAAPLRLELSQDNFGDHRVRRESSISIEKFDETNRQVIEVTGGMVDAILDVDTLPHPIIVKMDTQGSEVEVIKGGRQLFNAADYVLSEYCPYMLLRAGSDPIEFINFVREFPYAAMVGDQENSILELKPNDYVIQALQAIPQDGSAARHVDILLAHEAS